jgi:hypothetical protein
MSAWESSVLHFGIRPTFRCLGLLTTLCVYQLGKAPTSDTDERVCAERQTDAQDRQTFRQTTLRHTKEHNTNLSNLVGLARTFLGRCILILQCIPCHKTVDTKRRVHGPRDPRLEDSGHTPCDCNDQKRSAGTGSAVVGVRDDGRGKGRHTPRERCTGRSLYLTHLRRPWLPQRRQRSPPPPWRRPHHPQPCPCRRFLPRWTWLSRRLALSPHSTVCSL